MNEKLRIGKIPFSNLFPIFHLLERDFRREDYEFVEGYPSALNMMLREGTLDISPSSSVEYLRHGERYSYLDGHSISSEGPVGSILLFSRVPIAELDGAEVFVTHQSDTSVALLQIILGKFYSIDCGFRVSDAPVEEAISSHSSYLAIGDEALMTARRAKRLNMEKASAPNRLFTIDHQLFSVYDLGAIWQEKTGLPFVFALWIARNNLSAGKKRLLEQFKSDLDETRARVASTLPLIAKECTGVLPPDEMLAYWQGIIYDLGDGCKQGLARFRDYLGELDLL